MKKLYADMAWPTEAALERMGGEIRAASARLERKRRERREARVFVLALALVIAAACLALWRLFEQDFGTLAALGGPILWVALGGIGATALLSPVLAYFAEEGKYEAETE